MKIKRLEICGFKSFGERMKLTFGDGITGVVGPNGCGKSNIIDSIRWVMGEMSAKHLRGRAMQDVIFAGSDSRGPLGMAEVTLTFANDGNCPPQYADYSEISITRRLHRDGTSEYLMNMVPCRLRDITDLFLGTGVGTRAYSIIEQGRIGFIVNSRPEDRRSLIEEVAGITRFKARKKAAERRMKSTEQNLQRVDDIIAELERQLASLKRQAQKAERYKRLRGEQRELDLLRASHLMFGAQLEESKARSSITDLDRAVGDARRSMESDEVALEADKLKMVELEAGIQSLQATSSEAETRVVTTRQNIEHWTQQLSDTRQRMESARSNQAETHQRLEQASGERDGLESQLEGLQASSGGVQAGLERLSAEVEAAQSRLGATDGEIERQRAAAVDFVHLAAQQRARMTALDKEEGDLRRSVENMMQEQAELAGQLSEARRRRETLSARDSELRSQLASWRARLTESQEAFKNVSAAVGAAVGEINDLNRTITERSSRLKSLEEIARSLEGYSDGVRTLMGGAEGPVVAGLDVLVTDVLTVPERFEMALEAVLGERLQYIVVDTPNAGVDAIAALKRLEGGRSGFIPRGLSERESLILPDVEGVLGLAKELVGVQDSYQRVADALLADIVIVEDLAAAQRLLASQESALGRAGRIVTLNGEVLESSGILVGGTSEGGGLLASKREIRELIETVAALQESLATVTTRQEELEQERLQLEIDIQQLDKEVRAAEIEMVELTKDLEVATSEARRFEDRSEVLQYELDERREGLIRVAEDKEEARRLAEQGEVGQREAEERIGGMVAQRQEIASLLEDKSQELTSLKVDIASREERIEAVKGAIERLGMNAQEQQQRLEQDARTIADGVALISDLEEKLAVSEEEVYELVQQASELRDQLSERRRVYEEERGRVASVENGLRERRRTSGSLNKELTDKQMYLQKLEMEQTRLCDQIYERHDVELRSVMEGYRDKPAPGPEEEARVEEIERLIKNMGSINLTAIEEHQEVLERYEFLTKQRDDLLSAVDSLRKAINQINRTSRVRFKEAFEAVNEMFQKIYPRLFRGGTARLELCDSDDLLECGVDIIAQPPGKKLQNVGLLSGGEKALTATALVFSIFLIKPTPFCVMDEVDAPLDDANVGRFNEMLREISKVSQFIVITHNKQTMSSVDKIYGITMEEPGMSKIVSVDLETVPRDRAA